MYAVVPLLSALGVQPVAFTPAFRYVSTARHDSIHCCLVIGGAPGAAGGEEGMLLTTTSSSYVPTAMPHNRACY